MHVGNRDVDEDQQELDKQNLKSFRKAFKKTIISAGGYVKDTAEKEIESGDADLIAFGIFPLKRHLDVNLVRPRTLIRLLHENSLQN